MTAQQLTESIQQRVNELGPWFHNLHLPDGTETAPAHKLGDFPSNKWSVIAPRLPDDLTGWTAMDIGCNAGFYSFELARRGASVTAIDYDDDYLAQARWAAEIYGLEGQITFRRQQIYDLAREKRQFDLVWFMGVFYHLRYPLLGLDIASRLTRRLMVFQTMTAPGEEVFQPPANIELDARSLMSKPGWPTLAFIEHQLANDPTNWWAANHACVEALLRSSGFRVAERLAHETYLCEPAPTSSAGIEHLLESEFRAATGSESPVGH